MITISDFPAFPPSGFTKEQIFKLALFVKESKEKELGGCNA